MFTVVITEKGGSQRRVRFDESEVTIGRVQGNDIVLPKGNVSKRHSRVVLKDSRFIVVDLKSTNGTYVNGRKITSPLVVKEGDKIYVGDFILTLEAQSAASPASAEMAAPSALPPVLADDPDEEHTVEANEALGGGLEAPRKPSVAPPPPVVSKKVPQPNAAQTGSGRPVAQRGPQPPPPAQISLPPSPPKPTPASDDDIPAVLGSASSLPPVMRAGADTADDHSDEAEADDASAMPTSPPGSERRTETALEPIESIEATGANARRDASDEAAVAAPSNTASGHRSPLDGLLADPSVRAIDIGRFDQIEVDRGEGMAPEPNAAFSSAVAMASAMRRLAEQAGLGADEPDRFELADGTHVTVLWPPITATGPAACLRRRPSQVAGLRELRVDGLLDMKQSKMLTDALVTRENILIVGPEGPEVARLTNALLAELPEALRVLAIEPAAELGPAERLRVCLHWPDSDCARLLDRASGFAAERWVLHSAPSSEAAALLRAMAARSDGSLCTLRAHSLDAALDDLRHHTEGLGEQGEALLAAAFPVVVELGRSGDETKVIGVSRLRVESGRASAA